MTPHQWAWIFACATAVAVGTAVLAWRRRDRTPAATALAVTMAGVAVWSAADAVLHGVGSEPVRLLYPPVLLAAVGVVVIAMYVLARTVADPSWRLARRSAVLLAVEPALLVVAASLPVTRDLVMYTDGHAGRVADEHVVLGPLFGLHTVYSYVVIGAAYVHLLRRWVRATGIFRRQIGILLGAALLSTVGNVLTVASQAGGSGVDVTPVFFAVTGAVNSWALLRLGLLRLVPVARDQVVDTVPDAVLVVDPDELLIDLNPAARRLLDRFRPQLAGLDPVGRPLAEVVGDQALAALERTERRDGHRLAEVRPGLWMDVRDTPVSDPRGRALGRILVIRDVSEQQARQEAVEALNRQLAEQVSVIDQLRAELAEEAIRDPLTGLHNRRHLDRVLARELEGGPGAGHLAVLAVDIDHFKAVNDRFGHAAGDGVLTTLARLLQAAVREGDTAVRLGGEEFLVLLPGIDREQAVRRAEQVRRDVASAVHVVSAERIQVTVSIGVAVSPVDGTSAGALLEAADGALYTAKASGRNRVVTADACRPQAALARSTPGPATAG